MQSKYMTDTEYMDEYGENPHELNAREKHSAHGDDGYCPYCSDTRLLSDIQVDYSYGGKRRVLSWYCPDCGYEERGY